MLITEFSAILTSISGQSQGILLLAAKVLGKDKKNMHKMNEKKKKE